MRLGFAVKVLGREGLKSHDTRRWQSGPHLSVSLEYLDAIFDYLAASGIRMYRVASQLAPYVTHPDLPQFHRQLDECAGRLADLGAKARRLDLRLSTHPSQYIVLNSPDEAIVASAIRDLEYHAALLDSLGAGRDAVVVVHGGGLYGDATSATDRFVGRYDSLSDRVRARLVLENDDRSFPLAAVLRIHERTGIPIVLDTLHHQVLDPDRIPVREALERALSTWPPGVRPKIHFSSPRPDRRTVARRVAGERRLVEVDALPSQHADWIDATAFADFLSTAGGLGFDCMLEAKQKDLALLRLRAELAAMGIEVEREVRGEAGWPASSRASPVGT